MTQSETESPIVRLRLDGGELTETGARALAAHARAVREDRSVRVVIVDASINPFCSGPAAGFAPVLLAGTDDDPAAAISALRPPVITVVDGPCLSVGLELVLASDICLAGPDATFAFPDVAAGRLPCWGGTQRLPRAVPPATATAMLLTGEVLDADRACSLGLVHEVADDPAQRAAELADSLLALGPLALELTKEAVHRGAELPLRDGLRLEGDLNHQLAATEDRAEGLAAFFDKRPPDFSGR